MEKYVEGVWYLIWQENPIEREIDLTLLQNVSVWSLYSGHWISVTILLKYKVNITVFQNSSNFMNTANFQSLRPLPSLQILVDKINLEHSVPMYAEQLVHVVSSLTQPSDNLLHYCYAHCYLKVWKVNFLVYWYLA